MPSQEILSTSRSDIVAIIDDDRVFQQVTRIKLARRQLARRVLMFSDGDQAMQFFAENAADPEQLPDIILLDLNMPIMDGWDFLEAFAHIKPKLGKKVTIFVATSSVNPEDHRRAKTISEISDFIVKPIPDERLMRIFEPLCE